MNKIHYEIPLGEEYYQDELEITRERLGQSQEIIARLNAENHSLHAALTLAQARATAAEHIIDCVSIVAADIYKRENVTSWHGCRVRADLEDPLRMIEEYSNRYMRKDDKLSIANDMEDNDGEVTAARIRKLEREARDLQQKQKITVINDSAVWNSLDALKQEILNPSGGSRGDELLREKFRDLAVAMKPYRKTGMMK